MTTWTDASLASVTWTGVSQASDSWTSELSDLANGYVDVDYVIDGYILGTELWAASSANSASWSVTASVSTVWA